MEYLKLFWSILSFLIITLVAIREPNTDSVGEIIQESLFRDEEPLPNFDKAIGFTSILYVVLTGFLCYRKVF
jgi:hypothetical protein